MSEDQIPRSEPRQEVMPSCVERSVIDFSDLQSEIARWGLKNFPNARHHHPLLGVVEEVGELSHAHLKTEQGIRGTAAELLAKKEDAVGDIVVYLIHYCVLTGLNFEDCVRAVWRTVRRRDWQANRRTGESEEPSQYTGGYPSLPICPVCSQLISANEALKVGNLVVHQGCAADARQTTNQ